MVCTSWLLAHGCSASDYSLEMCKMTLLTQPALALISALSAFSCGADVWSSLALVFSGPLAALTMALTTHLRMDLFCVGRPQVPQRAFCNCCSTCTDMRPFFLFAILKCCGPPVDADLLGLEWSWAGSVWHACVYSGN